MKANRKDLVSKEQQQISVLESYVLQSNAMSDEEIKSAVQQIISELTKEEKKIDKGSVMKGLVGPGGTLVGQTVDKQDIARIVEGLL